MITKIIFIILSLFVKLDSGLHNAWTVRLYTYEFRLQGTKINGENNTQQRHNALYCNQTRKEEGNIIIALAVKLRLWYRTLTGAPQDINNLNKRLHFPHFFLSLSSEILKYIYQLTDTNL